MNHNPKRSAISNKSSISLTPKRNKRLDSEKETERLENDEDTGKLAKTDGVNELDIAAEIAAQQAEDLDPENDGANQPPANESTRLMKALKTCCTVSRKAASQEDDVDHFGRGEEAYSTTISTRND